MASQRRVSHDLFTECFAGTMMHPQHPKHIYFSTFHMLQRHKRRQTTVKPFFKRHHSKCPAASFRAAVLMLQHNHTFRRSPSCRCCGSRAGQRAWDAPGEHRGNDLRAGVCEPWNSLRVFKMSGIILRNATSQDMN